MIHANHQLQLNSGSIIGNGRSASSFALSATHGAHTIAVPIPAASAATDVENAIQIALAEAARLNIKGNDVTPFVLKALNTLTHGQSLR